MSISDMKVYDGSHPWPTPLEDATEGQVLVPLLDGPTESALAVGADLARRASGEVVALDPVVDADPDSLDARYAADAEVGKRVQSLSDEPNVRANGIVRTGESVEGVVTDAAEDHPVEALVVPVGVETTDAGDGLTRDDAELLGQRVACRTVTVTGPLPEEISSVLLPVAGGPHSGAAARVARAVADANDAAVEVVHVVAPDADDDRRKTAREYVDAADEQLVGVETATDVVGAEDPAAVLARRTDDYDATVLGVPSKGRLRRLLFGSVPGDVAERADGAVLTVRSADDEESALRRWL